MLVRFSSVSTESITMFGDNALQLIKMLGASGAVPGALSADDIPAALSALQERLRTESAPSAGVNSDTDEDGEEREAPIGLATRAMPLVNILQRAAAAKVPVMWEKA